MSNTFAGVCFGLNSLIFVPVSIQHYFQSHSFQLPVLEGQPNVTALDLQMKSLRDAAMNSITQMAICMKEEATDVKATVGDIEDWLNRIKQLAEEVRTKKTYYMVCIYRCSM